MSFNRVFAHQRRVVGWVKERPPQELSPQTVANDFRMLRERFVVLAVQGRLPELAPDRASPAEAVMYTSRLHRLLHGDTVQQIAEADNVRAEAVTYMARYALRRLVTLPNAREDK